MKTVKTLIAVALIAGITNISFGQNVMQKAKEAAAKTKDKKDDAKKGGKGGKDMAVKGSGVPTNGNVKKTNTTPTTPATNK